MTANYVSVMRTGYIVVYHGGLGERFIQKAAFKRYRGMYRNRRLVGVDKATWTPERDKALAFTSKAQAERQIRLAGIPATSKSVAVERVKVERYVRQVMV